MTFSCEGDTSKYNMVYVTSGGKQSMEFAFNKCVSGWCRTDDDFFPYTQGDDIDFTPTFDNVTLSGYGYDKNIHIWKPDDYDASSEEKYSTIYILDGQNIADFGINGIEFKTRPGFIEQVRSMSMETGSKAIIVAVENLDMREYELIPDMEVSKQERKEIAENGLDAGEPVDVDADYDAMNGIQFAHFIAKKVVPYVQQNYNVYKDALHTSVQGASLGGMESFYIACEYPDTFGSVGAMSPSFYEFDGETWKEYLSEKSFTDSSPFIYLYTGPAGADTDPDVTDMYERLRDLGYPKEKLALHFNEEGTHSGIFWRSVFSEYLTAMVFQNIEPLQKDQT